VVVGDSTLDVTVRPVQPLRAGSDMPAQILVSPGGQGANVAVRLARQGRTVRLITAVADDAPGRLLHQALDHERVELTLLPAAATGRVVSLIDSSGERTMASDRAQLDAAEIIAGVDAAWLYCSGYPLADEAFGDGLAHALGQRPATTRLSIGGGSVQHEMAATFEQRVVGARADVLLLSVDEAGALIGAGQGSPGEAAAALSTRFATHLPGVLVVVTGGSQGSAAAGGGRSIDQPAHAMDGPMVDATGAGDAYAAALIARLVDGAWPPAAPELQAAMAAASRLGALVSRAVGAQVPVAGEQEPLP